MKQQPIKLYGYRASPLLLALIAAVTVTPAFAQTAPTAQAAPTADASGAPTTEGRPSSDPAGTPPSTDAQPMATTSASRPASFKELDANHDGKLSKEEVAGDAMWSSDFDVADADKDGFISKSEFKKHEADVKKTAKLESTQH